jgi:hypothetical protein
VLDVDGRVTVIAGLFRGASAHMPAASSAAWSDLA